MNNVIDVGYSNNEITVSVNNATPPLSYSDMYNGANGIDTNSPVFQQKMRYLDSKKDLLGLGGFNDVILKAYGLNLNNEPPYVDLKRYKVSIIQEHAQFIETKSWAKTKIRNSLEVDLIALNSDVYLFRESSMDLTDDIVDANNNKIIPKDIACFSNTILDPLKRSFLTSNALHFPRLGTPLVFNQSFIDGFLRFVNCTNVSSTLISETALRENRYTYNYEYDISYLDGTNISGNISYPNNSNDQSKIINKYVIVTISGHLDLYQLSNPKNHYHFY